MYRSSIFSKYAGQQPTTLLKNEFLCWYFSWFTSYEQVLQGTSLIACFRTKLFFILEKLGSLFSHVGCVLPQEDMPGKDCIQKEKEKAKILRLKDQELLLHYSPKPQQHQLLVLPIS